MRAVVFMLLILCSAGAFAEKKFEYLLPEDWKPDESPAPERKTLDLNVKQYLAGMKKHIKEIPQCSSAKFEEAKPFNNGDSMFQTISWDGAKVDSILSGESGKGLREVKISAPKGAHDEFQMRAMMCATYALIRTLSPKYFDQDQSLDSAKYLFFNAKERPSKLAVMSDVVDAKLTPLEIVAHPQKTQ